MSPFLAPVRRLAPALIFSLALLTAFGATAQEMPAAKITGDDLRRALIWTGHLSAMSQGDPAVIFQQASRDWQKANGHAATERLPDEQISELLSDGEKQRDAFGWTTLEDKSIGFSIGVPTKLVKFVATRTDNGTLLYDFDGSIRYSVIVRYGDLSCSNMNFQYASLQRITHATYKAHGTDWYAMAGQSDGSRSYLRAVCRTAGIVAGAVSIAESLTPKQELLFSAMADSLSVGRNFNPTAVPHPRLDQPTPTAGDFLIQSSAHRDAASKPKTGADTAGTTDAIKRETRTGGDLSIEQVFEKVSPAVYTVKAGDLMGSAVAISTHELLTNCHVVKDSTRVTLTRDKKEQPADVVSVNPTADRCVLRTAAKLDTWVTVRPYDDIKVGERALTIGTPQGLELTVADGIVSSKRTLDDRRLVQTTASISQGSSGGGLFDAQGHLLGITTFYLKVGQNLNFAVAAEEFAK